MKAQAIIFDKDGTLIAFDAFWVKVSQNALNDILSSIGRCDIPIDELLACMGVENGVTDIDGILCKGTYAQMGCAINEVLKKYGFDIDKDETVKMVIEAYNKNADTGDVVATCENIADVLLKLKKRGIKLAVVTTDNEEITHTCLKKLGITSLFDKIYTDDGKTPVKPDPFCVNDISAVFGIDKENIVMVGDTMTDVNFAKNAGITVIGVGSCEKNRERLLGKADFVIPDISHIFGIIGEE